MRGRKTNWTVEFKLRAVARMEGASDVSALAAELGVGRERLYEWRRRYEAGGVEALRSMGRPRAAGRLAAAVARRPVPAGPGQRIGELERVIGQQLLDLDFFAQPCGAPRRDAGRAASLARST